MFKTFKGEGIERNTVFAVLPCFLSHFFPKQKKSLRTGIISIPFIEKTTIFEMLFFYVELLGLKSKTDSFEIL